MKWCLSNQFDGKDVIYQAGKTKLPDIRNSSTGTNNLVKPDLENTIVTTKTTTTTTTVPTAATLGQHSNSEDASVNPECNKTISNELTNLIKVKTMQILQSSTIAPTQKNYQIMTMSQ